MKQREEYCTHPNQVWCDCDWCRLVREEQKDVLTLPADGRYTATQDEIEEEKAILRRLASDPTTPDLLDVDWPV